MRGPRPNPGSWCSGTMEPSRFCTFQTRITSSGRPGHPTPPRAPAWLRRYLRPCVQCVRYARTDTRHAARQQAVATIFASAFATAAAAVLVCLVTTQPRRIQRERRGSFGAPAATRRGAAQTQCLLHVRLVLLVPCVTITTLARNRPPTGELNVSGHRRRDSLRPHQHNGVLGPAHRCRVT